MGRDSDDPRAAGEVGRVGVAIDSHRRHAPPAARAAARQDLDVDDHQRDRGDPALPLHRGRRGAGRPARASCAARSRTTSSRSTSRAGTYIYPPAPSLRLISDIFAFAQREVPQLEHHLDQRLPHARSGLRRHPGGRVHARRRHRLREGRRRRRGSTSTSSARSSPSSSTGTTTCSKRSPSSAPRARMWSTIMSERFGAKTRTRARAPLPLPDRGHDAHRAAAAEQRRARRAAGARGGARRLPVAAHQQLRRGARPSHGRGGHHRASHAADHRARERRAPTSSIRSAAATRSRRSPAASRTGARALHRAHRRDGRHGRAPSSRATCSARSRPPRTLPARDREASGASSSGSNEFVERQPQGARARIDPRIEAEQVERVRKLRASRDARHARTLERCRRARTKDNWCRSCSTRFVRSETAAKGSATCCARVGRVHADVAIWTIAGP